MNDQYLTEKLLGVFLNERFANYKIIPQYKINRFKIDYFIIELNTAIEFNGYRHYNSTQNIIRDEKVDKICKDKKIKLINIPYFAQLDNVMITYFFKDLPISNYKDFNLYPHGFIDPKALRPYDFCVEGLLRFKYELNTFPSDVSEKILKTSNINGTKTIQVMNYLYDQYPISNKGDLNEM